MVALAASVLASCAAWTAQGWRASAVQARSEATHAAERDAQAQATVAAVEAAREEGKRRTAAVEKARDDATKQAAAAVADAAGARAERDGLRYRAYSLARAAIFRDPAAADGSPAGANAVDLLAYMLGRVSDRAEELAAVADRARIAGLTCERAYDAVRAVAP
ncbi:DUF2514 family protein [Achromobacter sp.]|uniref:DUF2514 family protein n=1 Tax=Achromobacter sp. TaxID=134375 RepID=UPI000EDAA532|nr:DUF2514 family protein [Achromobacter sp.]HCW20068.1 DUF2514 domain-containing protein [Achromobacter sp.]